jgi:hypothetical protein
MSEYTNESSSFPEGFVSFPASFPEGFASFPEGFFQEYL